MAISNLVSVGYQKDANSRPQRAYFRSSPSNDNLQKTSNMVSASFERSILDSISTLNIQLENLRNSSLEVVKSLTKLVTTIDKVDRDMTARFRVLKKEIENTRSGFGKMTFATAAALPAGEALALKPREGKVATPFLAPPPGTKKDDDGGINPLDLAGLGGGKGKPTGPKSPPPKGGVGAGKTPIGAPTKGADLKDRMTARRSGQPPAARSPTSKAPSVNIEVPGAKVTMEGTPTKVESPTGKPAVEGSPTKRAGSVSDLKKKTLDLSKSIGGGLAKFAGPLAALATAGLDIKEAYDEYQKYLETGDKKHLKRTYEIAGSGVGGAAAGAIAGIGAGALVGSVFPGVGTVVGGAIGGVLGSLEGAEAGLLIGRAAYSSNEEGIPFQEAFALETLELLKEKKKAALDSEIARQRQRMEGEGVTGGRGENSTRAQDMINKMSQEYAGAAQAASEKRQSVEQKYLVQGPPAPPADSGGAEKKEESGESGSTSGAQNAEQAQPPTPQRPAPRVTTPPAPPAPPARPQRGPTVLNQTTNNSSTENRGGETNNVVGQNLPMVATDPFMQEWLSRTNIIYQ